MSSREISKKEIMTVHFFEGRTMTNIDRSADDRSPKFSSGVRELHEKQAVQAAQEAAARRTARALAIEGTQPKVMANEARGFDPYNTSGSFDRKKHWTRVGKR
jgi:hypothetical protein